MKAHGGMAVQLQSLLISGYGGEWWASHPGRSTPR